MMPQCLTIWPHITHYTCVLMNIHVHLLSLTVPRPVVEITSNDTIEFGKSATLECNAIAVRGITSTVAIIWSIDSGTTFVRVTEGLVPNIVNNSAVYTDQLITPPLSVNDSGRVYTCIIGINATFPVLHYNFISLDFTGKYI